jgi:Xaa-Pro aminopeptidase
MAGKNCDNIAKRIEKLRILIKGKKVDAVLVTKRENYIYLSGFTGDSAYLVITQDAAILLTDSRFTEQAGIQAPRYEIIEYRGSFAKALNDVLKSRNIDTLGFEEYDMSYERYLEYREKLSVREFIPFGKAIEELRMVKGSDEIETIRKAVKIADDAFTHILGFIKPGVAEIEIAAELEYFMKINGATGPSFETIIASGKRSSMPHGTASSKKVEPGDTITLDFGALYENYCSDMTRTVFVGEPDSEMKRIYGIVLEAQLKSIEGARKGLTGKEIDFIARDIIYKAGFENNFGHGLGHSVGLEIHEEPRLSVSGEIAMENGMAVTVEPGIYVPGLGGVRIEDIIVINDDKPIVLTQSVKDLTVI